MKQMSKHLQLKAESRKITGKKVKQLRKAGIIPASIYGKKTKSSSIQINTDEFIKLFRKSGETSIIDITVGGSQTPHHVLVREIQKKVTTGVCIHVSFQEVNLSEKIEAEIPVKLEGESPAVKEKLALLLQELSEITVEAIADNLPEVIIIDISKLKTSGDTIHVKDIKAPTGVEIKNDGEVVVVRLDELIAPESEELPEPETPEGGSEAESQLENSLPKKEWVNHETGEEEKPDEKVPEKDNSSENPKDN